MRYFKINNLLNQFNQPNYKGLDVSQFVPGGQQYAKDTSYCLIATNENVTTIPADVTELKEAEYNSQRTQMQSGISASVVGTLAGAQQAKYIELSQACQNAIVSGFNSTSYQNISKVYDSTLEDQANITGNALSAVSKISGVAACANDKFYYRAHGEDFTEWTADECLQLARDFKSFKEQQLIKNKELQAYVSTLTTVEDVQKITWNTEIPSATTTA